MIILKDLAKLLARIYYDTHILRGTGNAQNVCLKYDKTLYSKVVVFNNFLTYIVPKQRLISCQHSIRIKKQMF